MKSGLAAQHMQEVAQRMGRKGQNEQGYLKQAILILDMLPARSWTNRSAEPRHTFKQPVEPE